MNGTKKSSGAASGLGANALDIPIAALAALAVAFAVFAVPADQLAGAVGATGLPQLWPAAQPPLGGTARIALGAAGAVAIFAFVFGLLHLLGRKPARRAVSATRPPRVRRRDRHPDAPTRRPISATLDFGEPASNEPALEAAEIPDWLSPAALGSPDDEADKGELLAVSPVCDLPAGDETGGDPGSDFPVLEDRPSETPDAEDPLAVASPYRLPDPCPQAAAPVAPRLDTAPADSGKSLSIAELMARLEEGLARRQPAGESLIRAASPGPSPAPGAQSPEAPRHDDRLQSAIDSLQRLASRQG